MVLPGVYDALTAKIAAEVGFDALVMGGYSIAASRLGQPDVGYLSMTEMVQAVKCIVDATELPVFADGDTGYGNALSYGGRCRNMKKPEQLQCFLKIRYGLNVVDIWSVSRS